MSKTMERKVQLPVQMMRAEVAPSSFNIEKRTIDMVWSVGRKGLRGAYEPYYEALSMDPKHVRMGRLQSGNAPFCDAHNSYSTRGVLGVIVSAKIENGIGTCTVRLEDPDRLSNPDAKDTIRKIESGTLKNVSVAYIVYRYERQPMAEGEEYPTYLAVDWEPTEVSCVPVGFDDQAVTRGSQDAIPCVFADPISDGCAEPEKRTKKTKEVRMDNEQERLEQERKLLQEKEASEKAGKEAEKVRQAEIRRIFAGVKLPDELAQRAIDEDRTVEQAREIALAELTKKSEEIEIRSANSVVVAGKDSSEKWRDGASQWLMQRAGVGHVIEQHQKIKLAPGEFRGMSLVDLAKESLERAGVQVRGMDKMTLVGKALTLRSAGMQTTSDFAVLLESTMHKVLLAAYGITPDTWSRFSRRGSVSDFRAHPRYRQGTFGRLDKVGEHGEFTNKNIGDGSKESITAETFGNIIALSRQAIVNDDMGAFSDLAMRFGRAAKLSVEVDVYALLAANGGLGPMMSDGKTLFHADHSNIGTGSALSVAGIDADRVVMASQKDPSGNEILDLRPAVLVLPVGLGGDARVINDAQYDPDTANKLQRPNKVRGLFSDIVDTPRMTGTRRYLFADPSIAPVIEVAFLDGQDAPFIESQDGFRIDGVEWKVRLDYGVGAIDYRGAVTNAGA